MGIFAPRERIDWSGVPCAVAALVLACTIGSGCAAGAGNEAGDDEGRDASTSSASSTGGRDSLAGTGTGGTSAKPPVTPPPPPPAIDQDAAVDAGLEMGDAGLAMTGGTQLVGEFCDAPEDCAHTPFEMPVCDFKAMGSVTKVCMAPVPLDTDSDGTVDADDDCPEDATKTTPGDCGCANDPMPDGTACAGFCAASATCDGMGSCMDPGDCAKELAEVVSAGEAHSCALGPSGKIYCWGANAAGELGDGSVVERWAAAPVSGITNGRQVSAGRNHTCALLKGGAVKCWGAGAGGQLGNADMMNHPDPIAVPNVSDAAQLSSGGVHACAVRTSGAVACWGDDSQGQLGEGMPTAVAGMAHDVMGLTDAVQVAAGHVHTCALRRTREVVCWGAPGMGRLGIAAGAAVSTPQPVPGLTDVIRISAGQQHTCALIAGGTVKCWGSNLSGQLGNPTIMMETSTPAAVDGITDAVAISASDTHTCAVLATGKVNCWGANTNGQLGNDLVTPSPTPVVVMDLSGATQVGTGVAHTCAQRKPGDVRCWGANTNGRLGDGTATERHTPIAVWGVE
jgi:alpha-tubulin suppressor-like RCC1 family protein